MTNVKSLQILYVAFGGALTDTYDNICNGQPVSNYTLSADVIAAIAQVVGGGSGAALPEVTAEDNGKVLTVVDGAWAAVAPEAELPTVTAEDNGKVLTVANGEWAAATLPE